MSKSRKSTIIIGYTVVVAMTPQFGGGYCPDFLGLQVSGLFQPLFKNYQLGDKLLAGSNPLHSKPLAVPCCAAKVGEAKKIKGLCPFPFFCLLNHNFCG